jgi:drug/metabolite transporter (DMT)-like permease
MDRFRLPFLAILYASIVAGFVVELAVRGGSLAPARWTVGLGLLGGCGSIGGLSLLTASACMGTAIVFPVSGVSSIVFTAIVAVLALGERPNRVWFATLALGILAVAASGL